VKFINNGGTGLYSDSTDKTLKSAHGFDDMDFNNTSDNDFN